MLDCGHQYMTSVETSSLHWFRHTGRSNVANAAIGIQHNQQQQPICFALLTIGIKTSKED